MTEIQNIIDKHTILLNNMKDNRAKWEEEKWTDAQIQECDNMIRLLASILSDLNKALHKESEVDKKRKVTGSDILNWHGSDHSIEELADTMAEIVNGEYSIEGAKEDILNSSDDEVENSMCKKFTDSESIPDENGNCSLCGGDCCDF